MKKAFNIIRKILILFLLTLPIVIGFQNCGSNLKSTSDLASKQIDFGTGVNGSVRAIKVQSDGKILIGGQFDTYNGDTHWLGEGLVRINPDGSEDPTFKISGNGFTFSNVQQLLVQSDGKILISGSVGCGLARINSDGSFDPTFQCNKNFIITAYNLIFKMVQQPDGKILCVGSYANNHGLFRLNTDGTLDNSFQSNYLGTGTFPIYALDVTTDSAGKILVTGYTKNGTANQGFLVRLNSDGSTDTSFNANSTIQFGQVIAIQSDGKILLGGSNIPYSGNSIARYNIDGTPDISFNNNIPNDNIVHMGQQIVLQDDGKIILTGSAFSTVQTPGESYELTRLNPDGTRDTSFDQAVGAGMLTSTLNSPVIAQDSNGNILVGGTFSSFNGVAVNNIVQLGPDGKLK